MLDFNKELEKFKPMLNVNRIEEELAHEEVKDVIDIFTTFEKDLLQEKSTQHMRKEG